MKNRLFAMAGLKIKTFFTPRWIELLLARHGVTEVKHLFEQTDTLISDFQKADKEVNMHNVMVTMINRIEGFRKIEEDLHREETAVERFEYEGLVFLADITKALRSLEAAMKDKPELLKKVKEYTDKYEAMLKNIRTYLAQQRDMLRREGNDRYMIKDAFTFRAYLLKYWQMRLMLRGLKRGDARIDHEHHAIVKKFHKALKSKAPEQIITKLGKDIEEFDSAVETVAKDAFSLTQLTDILRHQLDKYIKGVKGDIEHLKADGFREDKIKELTEKAGEVEEIYYADLDDEYAKARGIEKKAD